MDSNFFLQDIVGISLAFLLFSFVFIFPGYVIGWGFNLLKHRSQPLMLQLGTGIFISISVIPAFLFLVYRFLPAKIGIGILFAFAIAAVYIYFTQNKASDNNAVPASEKGYQKSVLGLILVWFLFSVFVSADLQIGKRLYFSNNSYDMLTRVAVVDAMTRTGVPPVNPSYYPGEEVRLNFLYYYWYILASVVDMLGGPLVSALHAMIASISWCGIALFATVSTYMQVRAPSENAWKKTFIGIQLFAVSGLDCIIIILAAVREGYLPVNGGIEGWNMPIMSWLNAITWVPHHVAAAIACIFALLLLLHEKNERLPAKLLISVMIGLAFASAFGLSVWVMFVFAFFWAVWAIISLLEKKYASLGVMVLSGFFALIFISPFLAGLVSPTGETSTASSASPVAFYIRPFMASVVFPEGTPSIVLGTANFFMLPLNYLFELGFFFLMAAIWIQEFYSRNKNTNPIYKAELVLAAVTTVVLSFLYSTLISINDLGIRGWLPLQIILIVWAVDVITMFMGNEKWITPRIFRVLENPKSLGLVLGVTLTLGLLTTSLEAISLRTWAILIDMNVTDFPNSISVDNHLGERTFYARLAYSYISENTPNNVIIQSNPQNQMERPSGLYATRQMVISDRTIYGVPIPVYAKLSQDIGSIFRRKTSSWDDIDTKCTQYKIDILVFKDTDRVWESLPDLKTIRPPLYENPYYALYSCGK